MAYQGTPTLNSLFKRLRLKSEQVNEDGISSKPNKSFAEERPSQDEKLIYELGGFWTLINKQEPGNEQKPLPHGLYPLRTRDAEDESPYYHCPPSRETLPQDLFYREELEPIAEGPNHCYWYTDLQEETQTPQLLVKARYRTKEFKDRRACLEPECETIQAVREKFSEKAVDGQLHSLVATPKLLNQSRIANVDYLVLKSEEDCNSMYLGDAWPALNLRQKAQLARQAAKITKTLMTLHSASPKSLLGWGVGDETLLPHTHARDAIYSTIPQRFLSKLPDAEECYFHNAELTPWNIIISVDDSILMKARRLRRKQDRDDVVINEQLVRHAAEKVREAQEAREERSQPLKPSDQRTPAADRNLKTPERSPPRSHPFSPGSLASPRTPELSAPQSPHRPTSPSVYETAINVFSVHRMAKKLTHTLFPLRRGASADAFTPAIVCVPDWSNCFYAPRDWIATRPLVADAYGLDEGGQQYRAAWAREYSQALLRELPPGAQTRVAEWEEWRAADPAFRRHRRRRSTAVCGECGAELDVGERPEAAAAALLMGGRLEGAEKAVEGGESAKDGEGVDGAAK